MLSNRDIVIYNLLSKHVDALGYELWGIELSGKIRSTLRLYIENQDGKINVADCSKVSKNCLKVLKDSIFNNLFSYLEVSSPGVNRSLFKEEHYDKYVGNLVHVKLKNNTQNRSNIKGTLHKKDIANIVVRTESGIDYNIAFSNILKCKLLVY